MKRISALVAAAVMLLTINTYALYSDLPEVDVQAASALLADAKTGELLYERNIHERRSPASITKVMTCLLALEYAYGGGGADRMDEMVTVSAAAIANMDPDGSTQNLLEGEEISLKDLLYCSMLASANEACNVIAEHVAGSASAFVDMMNSRAKKIGMEETHFANAHGLTEDGHYTTAYDIYLLCLEAMKNERFMEIAHTETYTVPPTNLTPEGRTFSTSNRLISKKVSAEYWYPNAKGIKTGYTQAAGNCLASSAEKDGFVLVCVVLGAFRDEETGLFRNFTETRDLFEWGFNNFTTKRLLAKTEVLGSVAVSQGLDNDSVELVPEKELSALVPRSVKPEDVKREIVIFEEEGTFAPVLKGQVMGTVTLSLEGHEYGSVNLVAIKEVKRDETQKIIDDVKDTVSKPWVKWAVIGTAAFVLLYIFFTVIYNINRSKKKRTGYGSYKGKKRR